MQGQPSPNPYDNYNNNNMASNNASSQNASTIESPSLSAARAFVIMGFNPHHRRSNSDGCFLQGSLGEMGSEDDFVSAFLDIQKLTNGDGGCGGYSMDHDGGGGNGGGCGGSGKIVRHRQRNSSLLEGLGERNEVKKAISTEKLAEIWAVDPKRVKRILANRQSAARSKERKARYMAELERRVQSLQTEATNLSAQLTIYQRDTTCLITENAQLKIRLQAMKQQAQLREALNEALKQEIDRFKIATGDKQTPSESLGSAAAQRVAYTPLNSPSTLQYSPLPSPSTLEPMSYSPAAAASPSPSTAANLFPIPRKSVPVLAQLGPFHNSSQSGCCTCPPNNVQAPPEQTDSVSRLQGLESSPPFSVSESSSTTQLQTP